MTCKMITKLRKARIERKNDLELLDLVRTYNVFEFTPLNRKWGGILLGVVPTRFAYETAIGEIGKRQERSENRRRMQPTCGGK